MENMIEIPLEKIEQLIKEVYRMSGPVGYGHLHYIDGTLPDGEHNNIMSNFNMTYNKEPSFGFDNLMHVLTMDYVLGRCCKMYVWRDEEGKIYIRDRWMDHDSLQLQQLCDNLGIDFEVPENNDVRLVG